MKIYTISGLGADQRVFQFLSLPHKMVSLEWIQPLKGESITDYSKRLASIIDTSEEFCLIGVSFGGLIAIEINKMLNPRFTFLVSSAETKDELPLFYRWLGKINLTLIIPKALFRPPLLLMLWLFGTKQKSLLQSILEDTDTHFAKWAVGELLRWKNTARKENVLKIHGTADRLIPLKASDKVILIEGGAHFMIVDRADEISKLINDKIID